MTNMIVTPNQTRSVCPEDPRFEDNHCKTDADCIAGESVTNGNGKAWFALGFKSHLFG